MRVFNLLDQEEFQFQCGAIEGTNRQLLDLSAFPFQFQCGAIEGAELSGERCSYFIFQFQCGAIEGRRRGKTLSHNV